MRKEPAAAANRDNFQCRVCGSDWGVQIHHIIFRSQQGEDLIDNYVSLCFRCHEDVHYRRIELQIERQEDGTIEVFAWNKLKGRL